MLYDSQIYLILFVALIAAILALRLSSVLYQ